VPSNADIVQANSAAFSRKDVDAMMELYAPDAVVTDRRPVGWGEFRGRDSLRSYYQGILDNLEDLDETLEIVDDRDGVIIAAGHFRARLLDTPEGSELTLDYALRMTFEDGLIATMAIFEDAAAAALSA
jgi:ketosteroid isomerase-like protein